MLRFKEETEPQIIVPIKTFFSSRKNAQNYNLTSVPDKIIFQLEAIPINDIKSNKKITPIIPLGRFLSDIATKSIENNLYYNTKFLEKAENLILEMDKS